ncbi:hypothetical protein ACLMJK_009057 [Lecanora helva]
MTQAAKYPLKESLQSPPIDHDCDVDEAWVKDKTIVITGGASGLGSSFLRKWAATGATVIIGDINVDKGDQLVRDTKKETSNSNLYFFYCDVTKWHSQVQFFKDAVNASPHGGIDTVVANAGILDPANEFESPGDLNVAEPPPPNLAVLDVNLTGVLYTTHLTLFHLSRNPDSFPASTEAPRSSRDRHLLLLSSMAGVLPLPGNTLYATSKHAIVGLFRSLRTTAFAHGIRVNMLCPYFVDTPLIITPGRLLLAGGTLGRPEDVTEAGTRFVANPYVLRRAVVVGPKLKVKQDSSGEWKLVEASDESGDHRAIWEAYADDFEDNELFTRNYVRLLNGLVEIRGWIGWLSDLFAVLKYGMGWSR